MLAALIDATNRVSWATFQAASEKKIPRPEPFPRPGQTSGQKHTISKANRDRIRGWIAASRA